jgi:hypothetical protein
LIGLPAQPKTAGTRERYPLRRSRFCFHSIPVLRGKRGRGESEPHPNVTKISLENTILRIPGAFAQFLVAFSLRRSSPPGSVSGDFPVLENHLRKPPKGIVLRPYAYLSDILDRPHFRTFVRVTGRSPKRMDKKLLLLKSAADGKILTMAGIIE